MDGHSILTRRRTGIAEIGIGRTFQNVALFPNLSVLDNVRVGTHARTNSDIISDFAATALGASRRAALNERVHDILGYLDLDDVAHVTVSGLPFGTQKRVELARALAADRRSCCSTSPPAASTMRSPCAGRAYSRIRDERNITVLLVEHHMGLVMSIADHVVG